MPNIELHGFSPAKQREIFFQMKEALKGQEFYNEAVVTLYNDVVVDFNEESQPFLRICSTNPVHTNTLVKLLKPLGVDIETMVVTDFESKDK